MGISALSKLSFTTLFADKIPDAIMPRFAVVGRSNVGKSSLLNALVHPDKHFRTGRKPGVTRGLIAVDLYKTRESKNPYLQIVDFPGWGFSVRSRKENIQWADLGEKFLESTQDNLLWALVVDAKRMPEEEEYQFLEWIKGRPYIVIFSRVDRLKPNERLKLGSQWDSIIEASVDHVFWTSSLTGEGLQDLNKSLNSFAFS